MYFASDNWAGVHPEVAAGLTQAASGFDSAYGSGDFDKRANALFSEVFERDVAVFFVATGTAANTLALTSVARPGGVVFAHPEAHVIADECGAYQHQAGGRLQGVNGRLGKIDPANLAAAIAAIPAGFVHAGQPSAVTITQATEAGTAYSLDELDAIAATAKINRLPLHMDGARFANALVSLDVSPAEMTWKRGVDMLSFGGTKNGCWAAEAVVIFNPANAEQFGYYRMRSGHNFSKSRFVAAQFEAYFNDGLWLKSARRANAMAQKLAGVIERRPDMKLAWKPQANELFAFMPKAQVARLQAAGARFYDWPLPSSYPVNEAPEGATLCRLIASFATTDAQIDEFATLLAE